MKTNIGKLYLLHSRDYEFVMFSTIKDRQGYYTGGELPEDWNETFLSSLGFQVDCPYRTHELNRKFGEYVRPHILKAGKGISREGIHPFIRDFVEENINKLEESLQALDLGDLLGKEMKKMRKSKNRE